MNSNRLTLGGILDSIPFKCHWDKNLICDRELSCGGCEHQPPDDEKPNGKPPHFCWLAARRSLRRKRVPVLPRLRRNAI